MMNAAKLDLSNPRRVPARDAWRAVSDLFGGALAVVVWLALWTWMAAAVVAPLSGVVSGGEPGAAAAFADRART